MLAMYYDWKRRAEEECWLVLAMYYDWKISLGSYLVARHRSILFTTSSTIQSHVANHPQHDHQCGEKHGKPPTKKKWHFQPALEVIFWCTAWGLLCIVEQNWSIQNNASRRQSKTYSVGATIPYCLRHWTQQRSETGQRGRKDLSEMVRTLCHCNIISWMRSGKYSSRQCFPPPWILRPR